ncbi:MAG: SDR family oxidoreductase [Chloroflexi bacterium]|nr:SDR family oxidoreductase [Chloroflexota bacterium]
MTLELENKIAVVTGGANGIGRGIVRILAERGADIVVADMNEKASAEAVAEAEGMGRRAMSVPTDVADENGTDGMIASALSMYGRVDILVCNAGVAGAEGWWEREEPSGDDWDATYGVNVRGVMHSIESVEGHMMDRMKGKIVVVASIAARGGGTGPLAHYRASKAAALNVSQAFALRLAPFNVNVNTICPGLLWTNMWDQIAKKSLAEDPQDTRTPREHFEDALKIVPLGREQTPEDIGKVTAFLCSDRAKNITGQAINVDGGIKMN